MHFFRFLFQAFLLIVIGVIIFAAIALWYLNKDLPDVSSLKTVQMQVPLRVYSADNKLIAEFGEKRREPVSLDQIPKLLQEALIATEDQRFYEHSGVDFLGLARASLELVLTGKKVQGGSTLTMQVARNFFLDRKKTYIRKLREIMLSLKISHEMSKDKVLELYLNEVYFGKRAYGVAAAARVYYDRSLDQLTLAQMAMLAGLPQAPSAVNPVSNPKGAFDRRHHVLERMLEQNYITKKQFAEADAEPIAAVTNRSIRIGLQAPYIAEMVRDAMVKQYGDDAYILGLSVTTTVNSTDQLAANNALEAGLLQYDQAHGYRGAEDHWDMTSDPTQLAAHLRQLPTIADLQPGLVLSVNDEDAQVLLGNKKTITLPWSSMQWARKQMAQGKWVGKKPEQATDVVKVGDVIRLQQYQNGTWNLRQVPEAEAALISLNPENGSILAIVGGFNFTKSKFNRVTSAYRQPGSGFKPFIYSAALDKGYTLASIVNDAPLTITIPGAAEVWRPQNDERDFNGPVRLRYALMRSLNLVSARLVQDMTPKYVVNYAKRFGFDEQALPETYSIALGAGLVTPLELARAMATFANGGFLITPYLINTIKDAHDKVIFQADPTVACLSCENSKNKTADKNLAPRIVNAQTAYLINSAMKSVITGGTGRPALVLGRTDLAGKTGTTNDQKDVWFDGYNTQVLAITWIGFDTPRSTYAYGATLALPMWIDYMKVALKGVPESNLPQPPGIVSVRINSETGQPTDASDKNAMFEIFRKDHAPHVSQSATPAENAAGEGSNGSEQPIF
ncbi:MAG: penicillin-binding protein 1A [Gammaproteobacteria bacterium]|nr:penicillin-binding protein 1A [Gammaproteobacteria bacterium]